MVLVTKENHVSESQKVWPSLYVSLQTGNFNFCRFQIFSCPKRPPLWRWPCSKICGWTTVNARIHRMKSKDILENKYVHSILPSPESCLANWCRCLECWWKQERPTTATRRTMAYRQYRRYSQEPAALNLWICQGNYDWKHKHYWTFSLCAL